LRGFLAYEDLLRHFPRWREKVTFAAFVYPSRESMAEYLAYRNELEGLADRINEEWGTPHWQPILLETREDFPRSLAALLRYDVLLVNPIRDGLNLVAKEGALMNRRNGSVVLSRQAGSWHELSEAAIGINPYDIVETRDALVHALEMSPEERECRGTSLRAAAMRRQPQDWLVDQLRALGIDT
jgi:trehalose 6-phosphate synthase